MKRYISFLLILCCMQGMMAQTVIVCNAEGELPQLLSEKVHGATELEIHGPISKEDVRAINKYPQVRVLDFTEADLSVIPDAAWDNLSLLQYVYLPKGIDTLYLNAISCEVDEVDIILPGKFPQLKRYPIESKKVPSYKFSLSKENKELLYVRRVGIVSADEKILYKADPLLGYTYSLSEMFYSVEKVGSYAFSQLLGVDRVYIEFSENLKEIANDAFLGYSFTYLSRGIRYYGLEVRFLSEIPPVKVGEGNLDNAGIKGYDISSDMFFLVPDKDIYINADSSWGNLYLISESDWGNRVDMVNAESAAPYYDLQGRPVANPTRGIYIKDGKKVAIE
ncbi:MAG: hypothetical protein J6V12_02750 [Bacteroidaceae bacterium]|nr:hypothetical protein [Bacteroidaceae bacterium]